MMPDGAGVAAAEDRGQASHLLCVVCMKYLVLAASLGKDISGRFFCLSSITLPHAKRGCLGCLRHVGNVRRCGICSLCCIDSVSYQASRAESRLRGFWPLRLALRLPAVMYDKTILVLDLQVAFGTNFRNRLGIWGTFSILLCYPL